MKTFSILKVFMLAAVVLTTSCVDDPDSLQHSFAGVCVPDCDGKQCGDDGCEGSCGECGSGLSCVEDQCEGDRCEPSCAEGTCGDDGCGGTCGPCTGGAVCVDDKCCLPACTGKECGDDGCGGSCGDCVAPDPFCKDFECVANCTADCDGKECGDDGCGSACGSCAGCKSVCSDGECEAAPEADSGCLDNDIYWKNSCGTWGELKKDCGAAGCSPGSKVCSDCEDVCTGVECGKADSCECGSCSDDKYCSDGKCISQNVCGSSGSIAGLRTCPEGPVNMTVHEALVMYVFDNGYFIMDSTACIEVYVGLEWPYDKPSPGQMITLQVTELGSFKGMLEIMQSAPPVLTGSLDVQTAVTDISEGILPSEELESCLVTANQMLVTAVDGQNMFVAYGTAENVRLRNATASAQGDCPPISIALDSGVVVQYEEEHYLMFYQEEDVEVLTPGDCQQGDDSNWGFEETEQNDPPADFEKGTSDFSATWSSEQAHGGANSCNLTWFSQDNQDFFQSYYIPATAGESVSFQVWVLDNDMAGRIRQSVRFYDSDFVTLSMEYSSTYSEKSPDWALYKVQFVAPASTAFVRGLVRMYDVTADWDGDATVFIDDWNVAIE